MKLSRITVGMLGVAAVEALSIRSSISSNSTTMYSIPGSTALPARSSLSHPHPVVIWHGLGDSAQSQGMLSFAQALRDAYPGMFVHAVALSGSDAADQKATLFGQVNNQVDQVCQSLSDIPELRDGFDGIGFSQGGQFLRAYVQRCNSPPIRNLITFGSQHMGIADLPVCAPRDLLCRAASGVLRGGVNTEYAQSHIVTAQYYRNPRRVSDYEGYLAHNTFLLDINNEVEINEQYKHRLSSLDNFVMVVFSDDETVLPKESGWFSSYPVTKDGQPPAGQDVPVPLRETALYKEDVLGLRSLDRRGGLVMETCQGPHMNIDATCQIKVLGRWVGSPRSTAVGWGWRSAGRVLHHFGIHGGSWTGPLRWPQYTWFIKRDGSRCLQISPARFGKIGDTADEGPAALPLMTIGYDLADLALVVVLAIVLVIVLWKVVVVLLIAALGTVLLPGLLVGGLLVLPVVLAVFLAGCVVYLPFAVISSLIHRTAQRQGVMLPSDPAWERRASLRSIPTYGSVLPPAPPGPRTPPRGTRPASSGEPVDVEAAPPSYDEIAFEHKQPSKPPKFS